MTEQKKRINIELLLSLSATFLSLAALIVAIFQTKIAREQQQKSVMPYLQIRHEIANNKLSIFLENEGVGPAFIKSTVIVYGNEQDNDYRTFIFNAVRPSQITLDSIPEPRTNQAKYSAFLKKNESVRVWMDWAQGGKDADAVYSGSAIKEGEKQNVYQFDQEGMNGGPFIEWMRKSISDSTYQIRVTYSDVYDNCWQLNHKLNRNKVIPLANCTEPVQPKK